MIRRRQKKILVGAILVCASIAPLPSGAAPLPVPACVAGLEAAARERGFTSSVSLDDDAVISVVDATDAWAADGGADVVMVQRGDRLHVRAPGLGHATARSLARAAEASRDPVCTLAGTVAARIARPAAWRPGLVAFMIGCAAVAVGAARRAQNAK